MKPLLATVLLDPPTTLFAGAVVALVSSKLIGRGGLPQLWLGTKIAAAFSLLYALAVGWPFFNRADWMFVYLVDTAKVPLIPAYVLFVAIEVGCGVMGVLAVGVLLHLGKKVLAWLVAGSALLTLVATGLLTADQYGRIGTTAQWVAGTAPRLDSDGTMTTAMTGVTIVVAIGGVSAIVFLVRKTLQSSRATP